LLTKPAFPDAHVLMTTAGRGNVVIERTNEEKDSASDRHFSWELLELRVGDGFRVAASSDNNDLPSLDLVIRVERPGVGTVAERRVSAKKSADRTYLTETIVAAPASVLGDLRPGDRLRASAPALNVASGWAVIRPIASAVARFDLDVVGSSPAGTVALDEAVRLRVAHGEPATSSHPDVIADLEVHREGMAIIKRPVVLKRTANGQFESASIALGGPTPGIDVQAGEVLVATYSLDPERGPARTLPLFVVAPRPIVSAFALESLGPDGGRLAARTVSAGGQVRVVTTFTRPPAESQIQAELRTRRGTATTKELLVRLERSATDPMRYESFPIALAGDSRLAHVGPGDRIEARYESDRWAVTPMAALGVIGRPGVVRAIRVIESAPPRREVSEIVASRDQSKDSPYLIQVEFEAPPEASWISIRVDTGPAAAERAVDHLPGLAGRVYGLVATATPTIFQTRFPLQIPRSAGHRLIATFGSARLNLPIVAGALEPGHGRLHVVAEDAFGQPTGVSVVISSEQTREWTTGNTTVDIPAGEHTVVFSYPFGRYTTRAAVVAGRTTTVRANSDVLGVLRFDLRDALRQPMRPQIRATENAPPPVGWILDTTFGNQATVSIQLPAGRYRVHVGAPIDRAFDAVVNAGGTTTLDDLGPLGRLTPTGRGFSGTPTACAVSVTGSAGNWTTRCGESIDIPPGDVTVEFTGNTYKYRLTARVTEGQEERVAMPQLGQLLTKSVDAVGTPREYVQVTADADSTSRRLVANGEPALLPAGAYTIRFDGTDSVVRVRIQGGQTTVAEDPAARTLGRLRIRVPENLAAEIGGPSFDVEVWRGSDLVTKRAGARSPMAIDVAAGTYEVRLLRFRRLSLDESKAAYIAIPNVTVRAGDNSPVQPGDYGRLEVEIRDRTGAPLPDRIRIVAESGRDPDAAARGNDATGRGQPSLSRYVLFLNPGRYLVGSAGVPQKPVTVSSGQTAAITLIGRD
jgi:hypothetical protein